MMNIFSYDIIRQYYSLFIDTIGAITNEKNDNDNHIVEHDIYVTEINSDYCIAKEKCIGHVKFYTDKKPDISLYAYDYIPINYNSNDIQYINVDESYCIIYDNDRQIFYCLTGDYKQKILDMYVAFKAFNNNTIGE